MLPHPYTRIVFITDPTDRPERRQEPRHRIALPVTLEIGLGWTRDVSASGVYFKLFDKQPYTPLERGASITLDFVLEHVYPDSPFKVACEGEIVRIEDAPAHLGLAVRITSYDLDLSQAFRGGCVSGLAIDPARQRRSRGEVTGPPGER